MERRWFWYILVLASLTAVCRATFRLPTTITPTHYSLSLTPTLTSPFNYSGTVTISFEVSSTATEDQLKIISLHKDSSVVVDSNLIVLSSTYATISVSSTSYENNSQVYNLTLETAMVADGTYLLTIPFSGTLRQDKIGLHVGSYTYNSVTSYYMATNFWPTYARLAFPCFDEPQFKTVFDISIIRLTTQFAASNQLVNTSVSRVTQVEDTFISTPKMSVHSLSMFVAYNDTMYTEQITTERGTVLKLFKPFGMENSFSNKSFSTFQTYTEQILTINHPLGHIHIIVMPDLKLEAFGGFGMIFLREDILLPYQGYIIQQVLDSYLVILDQLIKQYVCHYVTPTWWSDVWLSEGTSMYMKHLILTYITSGLNPDQMIAVNVRQQALAMDLSDYSTSPLVQDVSSMMNITTAVSDDTKKYKGATLLLMIDMSFSGAATTAFITKYLVEKQYSSANTTEFFQMIANISTEFTDMEEWYNTVGYPYVSVNRSGQSVLLNETRSLGLQNTATTSSWKIPVSYTYTSRPNTDWARTLPEYWLNSSGLSFSTTANTSEWIIFNIKAGGYYRMLYNSTNLEQIQTLLKSNSERVDVINHAAIVDDVMAAALSGHLSYTLALNFLQETSTHARYSVWIATLNALKFLKTSLYGQTGYTAFKTYTKTLLAYPYSQVTALSDVQESLNVSMLRSLIIPWACEFEVGDCVSSANTVMNVVNSSIKEQRANTIYYDVDAFMCAAFKNMNETLFQRFFSYYMNYHTRNAMQYYIASGLGCVTNKNNLNSVLASLFNGSIYDEDIETVFTKTYSMMENVDTVLTYIVNNVSTILQKHGQPLLTKLIKGIGSQLNTADQVKQLQSVTNSTSDTTVQSVVSSVILTVTPRVSWAVTNDGTVTTVLNSVTSTTSSATIFIQSVPLILITIVTINFNKICIFI